MTEAIAKLRKASKKYIEAARRPMNRPFTCLEIARRHQWMERASWLDILAGDLESDSLMYELSQTEGQEEERTKELLKGNDND